MTKIPFFSKTTSVTDFFRVVILSFNHPEITLRCVKSVLNLGLPGDRVILIHNGSDRNFVLYLQRKLPEVQHLILESNLGFAGGANAGLQAGFRQKEWVYFLTNDTEALNLPSHVPRESALIAPLVHRRKTSVIGSRLGFFNPRWGDLTHLLSASDFNDLPLHGYLYAPGAGFLLSKDVFVETQGFDESLHTYWEDVDLSVRVQMAGYQVIHDSKVSLLHFIGKTCHRKSFYTTYLFQRNRKIVSFRYVEKKYRWFLTLILGKDAITATARLAMSRRWKDIWLLYSALFSKDRARSRGGGQGINESRPPAPRLIQPDLGRRAAFSPSISPAPIDRDSNPP